MPSLTTVTLNKELAFKYKKTIHTKSSSPSPPSFLDITPALQEYLQFIVSFTFSSQHQIAVFTSHNNSSFPSSLSLFLWNSISCHQVILQANSLISWQFQRSTQTLHILTVTIIIDCIAVTNPISYTQTRSCSSFVSFTHRSCYCNGRIILNLSPLSSLGILPPLPHMEGTDSQHQTRHAIAIIPHFILDSSEMNTRE